jgi:putative membrane-bound dehydrogenase-like protein
MMTYRLLLSFVALCSAASSLVSAAEPVALKSKTTHAAAYGPTKNAVTIDPAKDLPQYPAVEPKDAIATWQVKKGFHLELAAHEPQVRDPIAICFDEGGRMFACEMIDYSEMRDVTPHLGRISMLSDADGDGHFEKSQVFAEDLAWPTGLIWANGGLYVIATPDIWFFQDKDGDGKAELRERVFTGFGTGLKLLNVQGLANSPQWGQDNRIHILAGGGNRGVITCLKRPDLKGAELGGKDFWFDPKTHEFGLESGGAQYGMSFDNYGRRFACSNSDHLQHWFYADQYAGRNPQLPMPPARQSISADGGACEVFRISPDEPWRIIRTRWRIAGVVKGAVEGGGRVSGYFTGATGTTIFRGDAYGDEFLNNSFTGDAGGQLVHRKIIGPSTDGVSLTGKRPADEQGFEFAASKDTWVRVVNFANAPDGCLHIVDMYRQVIEHPWSIPDEIKQHLDLNRGNDRGRIYRIVKDGWQRPTRKLLAEATTADLVNALSHSNGWHRDTAQRLLYERQDKAAVTALNALLPKANAETTLHALGALQGLGALTDAHLAAALKHSDPLVQERAILLGALANHDLPTILTPRLALQAALAEPMKALPKVMAMALNHDRLSTAIIAANPEMAVTVLEQGVPSDSLLALKAAEAAGPSAKAITLIAGRKDSALVAAYAQGLRRSGQTLEKVDKEEQLTPLFVQAAAMAVNAGAAEAARLEALRLLGLSTTEVNRQTIAACLSKGQPDAVQNAALTGMTDAGTILRHWVDLGPKAQAAALSIMLSNEKRATALLNAAFFKPAMLSASQVQDLIKNSALAPLAKKVLASVIPPSREEVVAKFKPTLDLQGDATKGQAHYMQRCFACHKAKGAGMEVGPDLVTVKTRGREGILSAILEPHKEVAAQYIAYTFHSKENQTFAGVVTDDNATSVTLKMMGGVAQTLQRTNVRGSSSTGQSLMPEGLEQGMTPQDMADLLAFIEGL